MAEEPKMLAEYLSRDGQQIKLTFDTVRKFLVSGKPEFVTDQEIMLYAGTCKARGLNPFKKDCYLVKYTQNDPAATIVSIDYYRSRAKAQPDCAGWKSGIIIKNLDDNLEYRTGSFILEGETLLGGWFRAKPANWQEDYEWSVSLKPYIKTTNTGGVTRFWKEENQPLMIAKIAESQGLKRIWPDEFQGLFVADEIVETTATTETNKPAPKLIEKPKKISPNQQKAFYIAARNKGMDNEAITLMLHTQAGAKHIQDVNADQFEYLLDFVSCWHKPEPDNPQDDSKAPEAT